METGHGQKPPVRRMIDRGDHRLACVNRGTRRVVVHHGIGRSVVAGSFGDPTPEHVDLGRGQRRLALRHLRLAVPGCHLVHQMACVRFAGHEDGLAAVPGGEEPLELRHDVTALVLRRLVAAFAVRLEDRPDLAMETDRLRGIGLRRGRCRHGGAGQQGEDDDGQGYETGA